MGKAFAPRLAQWQNRSWAVLLTTLAVCACLVWSAAQAQDSKKAASGDNKKSGAAEDPKKGTPPPKSAAAKKAETQAAKVDQAQVKAESEARAAAAASAAETFFDPNAEAALENNYPELHKDAATYTDRESQAVIDSAAGVGNVDPAQIDRYVRHYVSDLTKKTNIQAVLDKNKAGLAISNAGAKLQAPIRNARSNAGFMVEYRKALAKHLPPLLKGHLFARNEAIIALAMAKDVTSINLFLQQINDRDQVWVVKLWSLRGLSLIADRGRNEAAFRGAIQSTAVESISKFVASPDIPWFIKARGAEALGSIRLASYDLVGGKAGAAEVLLGLLSDPKQPPELRAWAIWALGMQRIPEQVRGYNFALVAHHAGRCVIDLSEQINKVFQIKIVETVTDEKKKDSTKKTEQKLEYNMERIKALSGLIGAIIARGFQGEQGVRDSGLSNAPSAPPGQRNSIQEIDRRIQAVAKAAIELSNSAGAQIPPARTSLENATAQLKAYLDQNRPQSWALTPDGAQFPVGGASVASGANQQ